MPNSFTPLAYDRVWTNSNDFPTYQDDEVKVRADQQYLFDYIKDYLNGNGGDIPGLLEEIALAIAEAVAGSIPDGSIETRHFAAGARAPTAGKLASPFSVTIARSDGSNPGSSVSVDGSAPVRLLLPTLSQMGAAPTVHTHDDRYYTETESDANLAAGLATKSNVGHTHTPASLGAVPTTRKVNGKALSSDVSLTAADVGALSTNGGTVNGSTQFNDAIGIVGATYHYGVLILNENSYGEELPSTGVEGQLFFKKRQ